MDIKISELVAAIRGRALSRLDVDPPIQAISSDTRLIGKDDVFFAFSGDRFDGHDFIAAAIEKGARHIILSNPSAATPELSKKAKFIQVDDTIHAYGDLASAWRKKHKIPVVAITGSSGKTTVKELTAHLLSSKFKVLKNHGTENNLIGVPKTLLQLDISHEAVVIEMGTNQPGEIERLSRIVSPQIGILTMIGSSHLEGLKDIKGVRAEKLDILKGLERDGWLVLNGEDGMLREVPAGHAKVIRCGFEKEGMGLTAEKIEYSGKGAVYYLNGKHRFETQLLGRHNVLNSLLAIQGALTLGVDVPALQMALKEFKPVSGRLSSKEIAGIYFLDDTYNSNPGSFRAALLTLQGSKSRSKKGVVCGDMLELGAHSERLHRETGVFLAEISPDFVIAAGSQSKFLVEEAVKRGYDEDSIFHVKDAAEAGRLAKTMAAAGDLVLVKGSRGMKMEKVFDCFISSSTP